LRIDPECEAAVATLAQLSLQQSQIERAVELFARQADLARSEPELANALTYQYVSGSFGCEECFCVPDADDYDIRHRRRSWSSSRVIRRWLRSLARLREGLLEVSVMVGMYMNVALTVTFNLKQKLTTRHIFHYI
jgi:hypothetical protein